MNADAVWQEHQDKLRMFVQSRVRNECDAKDILQQVFLKLREKHRTVRDRRKMRGWIYQITRNAIVDHYRSRNRLAELPENLPEVRSEKNAWELISRCVRPFIEELPAPYRDALLLSELEGMDQAEVAKKLRIPLSTAKTRILRGKKKLREKFDECCIFHCDPRGAEVRSDTFGKE